MTAKRSTRIAVAAATAAVAFSAATEAQACAPQDPAAVAGAVQGMFSALERKDYTTARETLASDAYLFDNGQRFDRDSILALIQKAQASGATYRWRVTEPKVTFACDLAFITYENRGGVTRDDHETPLTWLESGLLRYEHGRWRIAFLHSTRETPPRT
jgi:hypothetical protein